MATPDRSILKLIKLTYSGDQLDAALKAWEDFTTYVTDCPQERRIKEKLREMRMQKYLGNKVNS